MTDGQVQKNSLRERMIIKDLLFSIPFAILNFLVVEFLYREIMLTTTLLILLTISFMVYYKSQVLLPIFFLCMLGAVAEMSAISAGAWSYTAPDFFNIPLWLFVLWGNTGVFIYRIGVLFERVGFHK
ncbi:hypothetical protein IHE50_00880 [Candidatus Parvarchaeota archaeon]|jgi:hypothetical protein|uniref:DUF2878 domain-containing protein n=1 Tax=Candidatus Acidifodinimicrobium mancum TaxID=2898728 RepID=A0A8T3UYS9_9ARCH|nr:hypothetical protein [Candidatus Acidifodinimicrobium mancum]